MDLLDVEDRERAGVALAEPDRGRTVPQPAHEQGVSGAVQLLAIDGDDDRIGTRPRVFM